MSAFGTLEASDLTPSVQLDFVYNYINSQTGVAVTANSATTDANGGRLRLQSGTNSAGSAIFYSRRIARYRPGQGMVARFTAAFTAGVASNTQVVGVGSPAGVDGYFFGFNGTAYGICHRNSSSDTWVAQTSWNVDKCDGTGASGFTINATYGNVYMIKWPFLGYGDICFYVLNPTTARWILAHVIRYPNTSVTIQITNPNLNFYARSLNAGATTNQIIYVGSVGLFISGQRSFGSNPKWGTDNSKTSITTETNILSLRNCTTFNGSTNRSLIRLNSLSCIGNSGANSVNTFRLKLDATANGSPAFAAINGTTADSGVTLTSANSVASVDTAGTTLATQGTMLFNLMVSSGNSTQVDMTPYEIYIAPGETLIITGAASVSSSLGVAVNWSEDI